MASRKGKSLVDWEIIEQELNRLPDSYKEPRFYSLKYVVETLSSSDPQRAVQQLKKQQERLDALVDQVVQGYHYGFSKSIQNYSQILGFFSECKEQVNHLRNSLSEASRQLSAHSKHMHPLWRKCVTLEASLGLLDELSALAEAPTRVEAAINCRDWHAAVTHLLDAFAKLARPEFQQVSTAIRQVLMDVAAVWEVLQSHLLQEVHAAIYGSALAAVAGADDAGLAARMALLGGGGGRAGGGGVGGGGLPQRTASQSYLAALASPAATPRKGLSAAGGGGAAALGLLTPAGGRVGGAGGRAGGATMQQLGARRREMLMETPGGPRSSTVSRFGSLDELALLGRTSVLSEAADGSGGGSGGGGGGGSREPVDLSSPAAATRHLVGCLSQIDSLCEAKAFLASNARREIRKLVTAAIEQLAALRAEQAAQEEEEEAAVAAGAPPDDSARAATPIRAGDNSASSVVPYLAGVGAVSKRYYTIAGQLVAAVCQALLQALRTWAQLLQVVSTPPMVFAPPVPALLLPARDLAVSNALLAQQQQASAPAAAAGVAAVTAAALAASNAPAYNTAMLQSRRAASEGWRSLAPAAYVAKELTHMWGLMQEEMQALLVELFKAELPLRLPPAVKGGAAGAAPPPPPPRQLPAVGWLSDFGELAKKVASTKKSGSGGAAEETRGSKLAFKLDMNINGLLEGAALGANWGGRSSDGGAPPPGGGSSGGAAEAGSGSGPQPAAGGRDGGGRGSDSGGAISLSPLLARAFGGDAYSNSYLAPAVYARVVEFETIAAKLVASQVKVAAEAEAAAATSALRRPDGTLAPLGEAAAAGSGYDVQRQVSRLLKEYLEEFMHGSFMPRVWQDMRNRCAEMLASPDAFRPSVSLAPGGGGGGGAGAAAGAHAGGVDAAGGRKLSAAMQPPAETRRAAGGVVAVDPKTVGVAAAASSAVAAGVAAQPQGPLDPALAAAAAAAAAKERVQQQRKARRARVLPVGRTTEQLFAELLDLCRALPNLSPAIYSVAEAMLGEVVATSRAQMIQAFEDGPAGSLARNRELSALMALEKDAMQLPSPLMFYVPPDNENFNPAPFVQMVASGHRPDLLDPKLPPELEVMLYVRQHQGRVSDHVLAAKHLNRLARLAALSDCLDYLADTVAFLSRTRGGSSAPGSAATASSNGGGGKAGRGSADGGGAAAAAARARSAAGGILTAEEAFHTLVQKFAALSGACMRSLRIELTLLTAHQLQQLASLSFSCSAEDANELPPAIGLLIQGVTKVQQDLGGYLTPAKAAYVFGGAAQAAGRLLTWLLPGLGKINGNGVSRIVNVIRAMQPTFVGLVSSAPMPPALAARPGAKSQAEIAAAAFDAAVEYYKCLELSAEDLLSVMIKRPDRFTLKEWTALLQATVVGRPTSQTHVDQMHRILTDGTADAPKAAKPAAK